MDAPLKYNAAQHQEYLDLIERIGHRWLEVFQGDTEFYSAVFWDLLSRIWRSDVPVRKTDALGFMTAIKSAHTAGKYVETAIQRGILLEAENPEDARSKLLSLSPEMRRRLDAFFDGAVSEVRRSHSNFDELGPSPRDP
jgi:hypothetical protein